jgi:3-phenylpropionate/cinnamic acid dioxygenase small subunit
METAKLEERLTELEDRASIQSLLDQYAATIDAKDWEGFKACFTDDAVTEYSWGKFDSVDAVTTALIDIVAPFSVTEHIITNAEISVDGDRARSHAKLWVICVAPDDPPGEHLIEGGHYDHEYVRGPEGWRLSRLTCVLTWAINGEPL